MAYVNDQDEFTFSFYGNKNKYIKYKKDIDKHYLYDILINTRNK